MLWLDRAIPSNYCTTNTLRQLLNSRLWQEMSTKTQTVTNQLMNICIVLLLLFLETHWRRQWQPTPVLLPGKSHGRRSLVGCSPWGRESQTRLSDFTFTFHFHALEKEMATHSSVLAWRIPGTGEPGGLPSMGSHRVGHDWSNSAAAARSHELPR